MSPYTGGRALIRRSYQFEGLWITFAKRLKKLVPANLRASGLVLGQKHSRDGGCRDEQNDRQDRLRIALRLLQMFADPVSQDVGL